MFTLVVATLLVFSNVSLFYVLVHLLKPGQRRLVGLDNTQPKSELPWLVSLMPHPHYLPNNASSPGAESGSGFLMSGSLGTPCPHIAWEKGSSNLDEERLCRIAEDQTAMICYTYRTCLFPSSSSDLTLHAPG